MGTPILTHPGTGLRTAASALWKQEEYQASLTECLSGLESSSNQLIKEANMAHMGATQSIKITTSEGE